MKIKIFIPVLLAAASVSFESVPSCREVMKKMIAATQGIKTLRYDLKMTERIKGKPASQESSVKLAPKPLKIYMKIKHTGVEVLFLAGKNNGDALVNPNGFPYVNLNLSPYGSRLREGQHHTLYESGFDYFAGVLLKGMNAMEKDFDKYFSLQQSVKYNSRDCFCVQADYPGFRYEDYTVKKGENLNTIARAKNVSEYMILEANSEKVSFYDDVKENQVIKIPTAYGKKFVLYIDKENYLPIGIKVYDDKGMYESYDYLNLQLNCEIKDEEFTKSFPGYGF